MKWEISHRTRYSYGSPVKESFNEVRLKPVNNADQALQSFLLKVFPPVRLQHYSDFYSNVVHHFEIPEQHDSLTIQSESTIQTHPIKVLEDQATPWPLDRISQASHSERCFDYTLPSRYVSIEPEIWRLAVDATMGITDTWQAALAIMRFVNQFLIYQPQSTAVSTHMRDVIMQRQGVCQDFAHVMLGLCRSIKIPALYVSGYLGTETASATHAWMEVFIPGMGWRGLDPTHNCQTGETYVKLAVGRDYADAAPVSGHYRGTVDRKMEIDVKVRQLS